MFEAKYYNVDLSYRTREDVRRVENFRNYLLNNDFIFETSGNFDFIHFEIFIDSETEFNEVNKMLDIIVFYDSIVEVT